MPLEKSIRTGLSLSGILDVYETNQVDTGLLPFAGFLGRMDVHSHFHLHHPNEKINDRSIFQDELLTQLVIPCEKDKVKSQQQETHLDVCICFAFVHCLFFSFFFGSVVYGKWIWMAIRISYYDVNIKAIAPKLLC